MAADGKFARADFAYDRDRNLYICPGGKELKTSGTVHDGTTIKYIAKRSDCSAQGSAGDNALGARAGFVGAHRALRDTPGWADAPVNRLHRRRGDP